MFKLALNAGHGLYTAGKRCLKSLDPNETREWWLNNRIADKIEGLLADYEGVEILRIDDTTGKTDIALSTRTAKANNWDADFYLAIHANAGIYGGSGGGIVAYIYNKTTNAITKAWQKELYDALIAETGLKGNRGTPLASANLHECRETTMPAVLLELGFMDSSTDVPIILTDKFATQCAEGCVKVIVKRWGLKKRQIATTVGKTYKIITNINRYSSAADAKAKINSKGFYEADTYYIYNKYPNGLEGMYNISKDITGTSAGSWINPTENVLEEVKEVVQQLYRVRKSKDDTKSQKGAFSDLEKAKKCCQKAGEGYYVFDSDFNIVYSYMKPEIKPENPKIEEVVVAVYDLDYPEKDGIIVDTIYSAKEKEKLCAQAIKLIKNNYPNFDENIAKAYFELAPKYRIDPVMVIAQAILETGWFKFAGSAVKPEQHNYCGLGVVGNGAAGASFGTIEEGVTAQLQHLFAYGSKEDLPKDEEIVDPRFKYVTRGIAIYWQQLAGRWAVPGYDKDVYTTPEAAMNANNTYGQKIKTIADSIENIDITSEDIKLYFPSQELPINAEIKTAPDDVLSTEIKNGSSLISAFIEFIVKLIKIIKEKIH